MKKIVITMLCSFASFLIKAQNVGIGTATPTEKLEVVGNIKTDTVKINVLQIGPNRGAGKILTSDASGYGNWQTMNIATLQGWGINGNTGVTSANFIGTTDANDLIIKTNNTEKMRVVGTGNVGIGTTTPAEKLEVVGSIKTDTIKPNAIKFLPNAGSGKLLTSDANGNASWQNGLTAGNVGFGPWGDCSVNNISEYNPVVDPTGATGDYFGGRTAISGNFAIVSAYYDNVGGNVNQGSASIFQFNGTNWVFMQKITDATGAAGDYFGSSVSISGNYAIIGSYADDVGAHVDQGSASIYFYNGTTWVLMQKITDSNGAASDFFGVSVSISGNYAIAGSYSDDVGANIDQGSVSIFFYNGTS